MECQHAIGSSVPSLRDLILVGSVLGFESTFSEEWMQLLQVLCCRVGSMFHRSSGE